MRNRLGKRLPIVVQISMTTLRYRHFGLLGGYFFSARDEARPACGTSAQLTFPQAPSSFPIACSETTHPTLIVN